MALLVTGDLALEHWTLRQTPTRHMLVRFSLIYVFRWWRMSPMGTECDKPTHFKPQSGGKPSDNNTLHTEPRAARLLETMMFAAAR